MIQLAFETSTRTPSVALLDAGKLLGMESLPKNVGATTRLLTVADHILKQNGLTPRDIALISIAVGPGSFTGLRVGVTTAKTLAFAQKCPLTTVGTLDAIAHRLTTDSELANIQSAKYLAAVLNAERGDWFAKRFERQASGWQETSPVRIVTPNEWIDSLPASTILNGPALQKWTGLLPEGVQLAPESTWQPTAAQTGILGWQKYKRGEISDPFKLLPEYGRLSAAEEKLAQADVVSG